MSGGCHLPAIVHSGRRLSSLRNGDLANFLAFRYDEGLLCSNRGPKNPPWDLEITQKSSKGGHG